MFIIKPNLPEKKIRHLFCSCDIDNEIEANLERLNISPVKLSGLDIFDTPVRNHPDMLCHHVGGSSWIFYRSVYENNKRAIDELSLDIILADAPQSGKYPANIALNAACVGRYIICAEKHTEGLIAANSRFRTLLNVKQGYAKCSVCIVDENSIITSDVSIYNICVKNAIDALLIRPGHIDLQGYDYGFIGGCSGLIGVKLLAFTGDIKQHPDYENIKKFCDDRVVEIISLSQKKLYDYGSLLPVDYNNIKKQRIN